MRKQKWLVIMAAITCFGMAMTDCGTKGKQTAEAAAQKDEAAAVEAVAMEITDEADTVEASMLMEEPEQVNGPMNRLRPGVPDTLDNIPYQRQLREQMKAPAKHKDMHYDATSQARVRPEEYFYFRYTAPDTTVLVKAIEEYTFGNGQEAIIDAVFAGSDKIVLLVSQGSHRIYSAKTFKEIGQMPGYIKESEESDKMLGNEPNLCRADMGVADVLEVNGLLYVVSTGGVIRVYDLAKRKMVHAIVLGPLSDGPAQPIEQCWLSPDGRSITYTKKRGKIAYTSELPEYCN